MLLVLGQGDALARLLLLVLLAAAVLVVVAIAVGRVQLHIWVGPALGRWPLMLLLLLLLPDHHARIRAVHRRVARSVEVLRSTPASQATQALKIGPIQFNILRRTVHTSDGQRIMLTTAEFSALEALANAGGAVVSRDDLSKAALCRSWRAEDRSVDQIMFNLRRKLPVDEKGGTLVQSIRGAGYWMRKPDARPADAPSPATAGQLVERAA